jgi:hypothetical protein
MPCWLQRCWVKDTALRDWSTYLGIVYASLILNQTCEQVMTRLLIACWLYSGDHCMGMEHAASCQSAPVHLQCPRPHVKALSKLAWQTKGLNPHAAAAAHLTAAAGWQPARLANQTEVMLTILHRLLTLFSGEVPRVWCYQVVGMSQNLL